MASIHQLRWSKRVKAYLHAVFPRMTNSTGQRLSCAVEVIQLLKKSHTTRQLTTVPQKFDTGPLHSSHFIWNQKKYDPAIYDRVFQVFFWPSFN